MSVVDNILGFFGLHQLADESRHVRRTLITHQPSYEQPTAEVDNLKERFSAKRYVEHMREAMNPLPHEWSPSEQDADRDKCARCGLTIWHFQLGSDTVPTCFARGRKEWLNHINSLSQDDARLFFADVDELITGGELVAVLTPDQELEKRQGVLDKWDEYNQRQLGLMTSYGVDSALMHKMLAPTLDASGDAFELNPVPEGADAAADEALEQMDDAEVEAWADDSEDEGVGSPPAEHDWDDGEYVDGELQAHCRRCGHLMRASDDDVPRYCLELDTWDVLPDPSSTAADEHMKWLAKQRKESAERLKAEQASWPLTPEEASNPSELVSRWEDAVNTEGEET